MCADRTTQHAKTAPKKLLVRRNATSFASVTRVDPLRTARLRRDNGEDMGEAASVGSPQRRPTARGAAAESRQRISPRVAQQNKEAEDAGQGYAPWLGKADKLDTCGKMILEHYEHKIVFERTVHGGDVVRTPKIYESRKGGEGKLSFAMYCNYASPHITALPGHLPPQAPGAPRDPTCGTATRRRGRRCVPNECLHAVPCPLPNTTVC